MSSISFIETEKRCTLLFQSLGPTFNACTPENHPIVFNSKADFKAGMYILGICVSLFPRIRIYTFQLMSNHLHLVLSGDENEIERFFEMYRERLKKYFEGTGRYVDLHGFKLKLFKIDELEYMRNAIAYTNRNGSVAYPDVSPFSYPWGANQFYFQPHVKDYVDSLSKSVTTVEIRKYLHSKSGDVIKNLKQVGGLISSASFCDIQTGEAMFRDARHYFYCVSKNVETYAEIARTLGECLFYTDEDLYMVTKTLSETVYNTKDPRSLSHEDKTKLASRLHYEYNAGTKQIQRLLSLDRSIIDAMFNS